MKKIKQDIADRHFEPVYLITGPEAYLRRTGKQLLRQALAGEDTMNYTYREGRDCVISEIKEIAQTLPFFAEKRLIILENTGLVKKGGEELAACIPELPDFTVLVLVEEETDKRSKLYKAIDKCGYVCSCEKRSEGELWRFVQQTLGREKLGITEEAQEMFLDRCGDDLEHLVTELQKLMSYAAGRPGIREEDVQAVTSVTAQNRVFDMLDAMTTGHPVEAFRLYEDLIALKEPPMRLLYLVNQQVNRLLQIKDLQEAGYSEGSMAEAMGLRSFAVKKYARQAGRFTKESLKKRLEKLSDYDFAIKNGDISDAVAMDLVLAEFGTEK